MAINHPSGRAGALVRRAGTAALAAGFGAVLVSGQSALAQTAPGGSAAAIAALKTYVTPDQTASIRLPANFKVIATGVGFIEATGPQGEIALFGVMVPAKNSPTTSLAPGGVMQPYAADPRQKFLQAINWVRQHNGKPAVQAQFVSAQQIQAPPAFGHCSLPMDSSGDYRDFFKAVALPTSLVQQERPLMEAILESYRLNLSAVQKTQAAAKARPASPAPAISAAGQSSASSLSSTVSAQNSLLAGNLMLAQAQAIMNQTNSQIMGMQNSVNNFDHGVLRGDTPVYAQGQSQPLFWVGH
jgi:hypothetical protein